MAFCQGAGHTDSVQVTESLCSKQWKMKVQNKRTKETQKFVQPKKEQKKKESIPTIPYQLLKELR